MFSIQVLEEALPELLPTNFSADLIVPRYVCCLPCLLALSTDCGRAVEQPAVTFTGRVSGLSSQAPTSSSRRLSPASSTPATHLNCTVRLLTTFQKVHA